jgi:hypothetical protein
MIKPLPTLLSNQPGTNFHRAQQGLNVQMKMAKGVFDRLHGLHFKQAAAVTPGQLSGLGNTSLGKSQQTAPNPGWRPTLK